MKIETVLSLLSDILLSLTMPEPVLLHYFVSIHFVAPLVVHRESAVILHFGQQVRHYFVERVLT